jgi:hypothetical protein
MMAKPSTRYRAIRGDGQETEFLLPERALAYIGDQGGEIIVEEMRRGDDGGWAWTEVSRTAQKPARSAQGPRRGSRIPLKGENPPESPEIGQSGDSRPEPKPLIAGPHKTQDLFSPQPELF